MSKLSKFRQLAIGASLVLAAGCTEVNNTQSTVSAIPGVSEDNEGTTGSNQVVEETNRINANVILVADPDFHGRDHFIGSFGDPLAIFTATSDRDLLLTQSTLAFKATDAQKAENYIGKVQPSDSEGNDATSFHSAVGDQVIIDSLETPLYANTPTRIAFYFSTTSDNTAIPETGVEFTTLLQANSLIVTDLATEETGIPNITPNNTESPTNTPHRIFPCFGNPFTDRLNIHASFCVPEGLGSIMLDEISHTVLLVAEENSFMASTFVETGDRGAGWFDAGVGITAENQENPCPDLFTLRFGYESCSTWKNTRGQYVTEIVNWRIPWDESEPDNVFYILHHPHSQRDVLVITDAFLKRESSNPEQVSRDIRNIANSIRVYGDLETGN